MALCLIVLYCIAWHSMVWHCTTLLGLTMMRDSVRNIRKRKDIWRVYCELSRDDVLLRVNAVTVIIKLFIIHCA